MAAAISITFEASLLTLHSPVSEVAFLYFRRLYDPVVLFSLA